MPDEWIDVRTFAREVPNCERGLVACGGRGCGANDACCVACWKRAGGRQFGEHTTEAWTDAGDEELRVRFLTDGASVHPGHFEFEAEVVDQVSCRQVVSAVDDEVDAVCQWACRSRVEVGHLGAHVDGRIDRIDVCRERSCLGRSVLRVLFGEPDLPVEIAPLDDVTVDQNQSPDTGTRQELCYVTAESAAADDENGTQA